VTARRSSVIRQMTMLPRLEREEGREGGREGGWVVRFGIEGGSEKESRI